MSFLSLENLLKLFYGRPRLHANYLLFLQVTCVIRTVDVRRVVAPLAYTVRIMILV